MTFPRIESAFCVLFLFFSNACSSSPPSTLAADHSSAEITGTHTLIVSNAGGGFIALNTCDELVDAIASEPQPQQRWQRLAALPGPCWDETSAKFSQVLDGVWPLLLMLPEARDGRDRADFVAFKRAATAGLAAQATFTFTGGICGDESVTVTLVQRRKVAERFAFTFDRPPSEVRGEARLQWLLERAQNVLGEMKPAPEIRALFAEAAHVSVVWSDWMNAQPRVVTGETTIQKALVPQDDPWTMPPSAVSGVREAIVESVAADDRALVTSDIYGSICEIIAENHVEPNADLEIRKGPSGYYLYGISDVCMVKGHDWVIARPNVFWLEPARIRRPDDMPGDQNLATLPVRIDLRPVVGAPDIAPATVGANVALAKLTRDSETPDYITVYGGDAKWTEWRTASDTFGSSTTVPYNVVTALQWKGRAGATPKHIVNEIRFGQVWTP